MKLPYKPKLKSGFHSTRDVLVFALGAVIVLYELLFAHPTDSGLIVLGGSLLGLPAFLPRGPEDKE